MNPKATAISSVAGAKLAMAFSLATAFHAGCGSVSPPLPAEQGTGTSTGSLGVTTPGQTPQGPNTAGTNSSAGAAPSGPAPGSTSSAPGPGSAPGTSSATGTAPGSGSSASSGTGTTSSNSTSSSDAATTSTNTGSTSTNTGSTSTNTGSTSSNTDSGSSSSDAGASDLAQLAAADPRLSTFINTLRSAGLEHLLQGSGPLTVFAPTNAAFNAIDPDELKKLLADKAKTAATLKHHVVGQGLSAAALAKRDKLSTLSGAALQIQSSPVLKVDNAAITTQDLRASNGWMHVIDAVLVPDLDASSTLADIALADPRLTTFVRALVAADLMDTLATLTPGTLFAPTNAAFAKITAGELDRLLRPENQASLRTLLLHHLLNQELASSDLPGLDYILSQAKMPLLIKTQSGVEVSNALVTQADIRASNGLVHIVDEVIVPPTKNVVQVAAETGNFATLISLLERANLVDMLSGEGPYTVFAPTDTAFENLDPAVLPAMLLNPGRLQNAIMYHASDELVMGSDLKDKRIIRTLAPRERLQVSVKDNIVRVGPAIVETTDILATNGVVHVISQVLLP